MQNIDELPIQRYYFSMLHLLSLSGYRGTLPEHSVRGLYGIVDNYYLESLAILRSNKDIETRVMEQIDLELKESREKLNKLSESKEVMSESEKEFSEYMQIQYITNRESGFRGKDLEVEMSSIAAIVMILSLLESTLLRINRELITHDSTLPKVNDVMRGKDNGIIKYLKYFEKYIEKQEKQFIVGTKIYEELLFWLKIRNNIVHSNNLMNEEIEESSKKLKIPLRTNRLTQKYRFNYDDVLSVASLSGQILDECINKGLYRYFAIED